ncbi:MULTISPECIES: cytochrome c [Pseudomonadaceae]|nr:MULTISPECIES: cytochrome c [Pseudomonadaceae]
MAGGTGRVGQQGACLMRWLIVFIVLLSGCDQMAQQPRADAQESSLFFPDGKVNQAPPLGTVARGELSWEAVLAERPRLTEELLARGEERYRINCVPCHGLAGDGLGTVVKRGFPQPPDFAKPRLMQAPDRHFLEVIADGYGVMYSYAARVRPADRWAIVAHIRALQLARTAEVNQLPEPDRRALEALP